MTEATNTKLMDNEAGGEQTQYESAHTFTKPPAKDGGTFGGLGTTTSNDATTQAAEEKKARGEKTAENIRFGESISEHGFGGETVGNSGGVGDGKDGKDQEAVKQSRREQGYGGGSGVGA